MFEWTHEPIEKNLAFYGAFHTNPANIFIHIIFVPMLWFSGCVLVAYLTQLSSLPVPVNLSTPFYLFYAFVYVKLDTVTGSIAAIVYFFLYVLANYVVSIDMKKAKKEGSQQKPSDYTSKSKISYAVKVALITQFLGWFMQIVPGHWYFEGRKPALLDSLVQSFTLAPLFVFYELTWFMFPNYQADLQHNVSLRIQEIQSHM